MMVVLGLFSVISAATLPVITAKQQMPSVVGSEGSSEDPWIKNIARNTLAYYNSDQPNTSAVMIGGEITNSPSSIGYPQLIVKDNVGTGDSGNLDASQIILLKRNGNTPYYAGRIMFENSFNGVQSGGSIALGANALSYENNTSSRYYNVAIGSNAMSSAGKSSDINKTYSIAIGSNALSSGKTSLSSILQSLLSPSAPNGIGLLSLSKNL